MSLESKLIFALGLSFALIVAAVTVSKVILPGIAKATATFEQIDGAAQ